MSRAFKFGCRARLGGLVGLVLLLVVALAVLVVAAPASPSVSPNLAVDLASSSFSDTSVQATAFGPSGTGSIVLQHNPGNLVGFDITVDASGGVTFTGSSASINPNLCGGSQFQSVLINTVSTTATTVRVEVACVGGATMGTGDLVLFRFGWSGAPGTVAVDSSSTLADSTPTSVPYTVANATVMSPPNLAVDLASSSFSDTSVQATAFGPSGTGSIVLQHNPGNLVGFDITVDASGGVTFTGSSASINPNLCGGSQFQFVLINTVSTTATTVRVAVACVGGATMGTGDLVLFRFGWSGAPGTVAVDSSSTLADSTPTSVPYTVANATVMDNQPPVITVAAGPSDAVAASGWYNRASSGTDGVEV